MLRTTRLAVWLLLLPSLCVALVVASSIPAQALTKYSPGETILWEQELGNLPGYWFDCAFPIYTEWNSGGAGTEGVLHPVLDQARCDLGIAVENDHELQMEFNGSGSEGLCFSELTTGDVDIGEFFSGAGSLFQYNDTDANAADCNVTQVCWNLIKSGGDIRMTRCDAVNMPSPTPEASEPAGCEYGSVAQPYFDGPIGGTGWQNVTTPFTPTALGVGREWWLYLIVRTNSTGAIGKQVIDKDAGPAGVQQLWVNAAQIHDTKTIIGVGLAMEAAIGGGGTFSNDKNGYYFDGVDIDRITGANLPDRCSFYWGESLGTDPFGRGADEPQGPIGDGSGPVGTDDPPVGEEPDGVDPEGDCNFSLTNPSTWATAGICALVGLIKAVLNTLGDIFGVLRDLLNALLGLIADLGELLLDLLIPDPDSWDTGGLITQVSEAGPTAAIGEVVTGLTETFDTYESASDNCGVLFNMPIGGDSYAADTCETTGILASLKAVVSVGLIIITGIGIVKMLGGVLER